MNKELIKYWRPRPVSACTMPRSPVSSQVPNTSSSVATEGSIPPDTTTEDSPDSDVEDDERILETSGDGRWQKINHQVTYAVSVNIVMSLFRCRVMCRGLMMHILRWIQRKEWRLFGTKSFILRVVVKQQREAK